MLRGQQESGFQATALSETDTDRQVPVLAVDSGFYKALMLVGLKLKNNKGSKQF